MSSYSGEFKSPKRANVLSVYLSKHNRNIISYVTTRTWERSFWAERRDEFNNTLTAQIIVHIWTGASVYTYFIFSRAPNMNQHRVCAHIISSSNEIHANKGADTAEGLIMNVITRRIIVIHS